MRNDHGPDPTRSRNGLAADRFVRAAEGAGLGLYTFDLRTSELRWSPGLLAILGLDPASRPSWQTLLDLVHPDDHDTLAAHLTQVTHQAPGDRHGLEFRIVRPDGRTRWLRDTGQSFGEGDERATEVVGAVEDVTRFQEAIAELTEREARFRAVFTSIDEGYCLGEMIVDERGRPVDYRFLEVNGHFEEMTGLADATGRRARELVPGLEAHWVETYARVGLGGETLRFENGSQAMGRWFDVFATPVEPHGRFALVFNDITARRRAEEELRESEARFRNMADNAPVMIWVTDADGSCTYLNAGWYRFTGQSSHKAMGLGWLDATHPDDRREAERIFLDANARQLPFRLEYRLRRHDGAYRWAIDSAAPRLGPEGEYLGYIGSVIDIEDRKQAEEQLRQREADERRARERLELLATISGELESLRGVEARAERLLELIIPQVADQARIEVPSRPQPLLAAAPRDEAGRGHGPATVAVAGTTVELDVAHLGPVLSVPVDLGGGEQAVLTVELTGADRPGYRADEALFVRELADRVSLLLVNAHLREREHDISLRLQRALLPDRPVEHPEVEIAARYEAAGDLLEVGGDWYETFLLSDGRLGVAVGDVVGHGLEAAAVMGRLRAALTALATRSDSPGQILAELDRFARGPGGATFATACCAVLDPATGELRYASAGHPMILVCTPDRVTRWLDGGRSTPLSVGSPLERRPEAVTVCPPGSLILLYSDGLVERRREFGLDGVNRLEDTIRALADAPVAQVCDRLLTEMAGVGGYEDDVVVLALRT